MKRPTTTADHPIYSAVEARKDKPHGDWLSTPEAACLVRDRLKREFPNVKFSVRSETFSGGSSVNVRWTGGPAEHRVWTMLQPYAYRGFDGMIDMAYNYDLWLLPDGTLTRASTRGTERSRGTVEAFSRPAPEPRALRVRGGAASVSCSRSGG